jgi:uncharacterized membrane protein YdjX (TVP38/TMEM64 family)
MSGGGRVTLRGGRAAGLGTVGGVSGQRVVVGVVALAAAVVVGLALRGGLPDVRESVRAAGVWAPMLFVLLQGAVTVTPVPRTVFTVAAGVLFGSVTGVLLAVAGTTLAAVVAFFLVRLVGGPLIERHAHLPGWAWLRTRLDRSGLLAMVSLRLIPAVPFSVMNYASAVSGVRFPPYLLGTVVGVLPGTVAIVVLGDAAVGGNPHPAMLAVSLASGLLGLAGALVAARRPAPAAPQRAEDPDPVR